MDLDDFFGGVEAPPTPSKGPDPEDAWVLSVPKPIWIVEPHADDAYLSLGDFITRHARHVVILTVYSGTRKRGIDARAYASAVGAGWQGSGLVESDVGLSSDAVLDPPDIALPSSGTVILPLGIRHPEHRSISALRRDGDYSYLETPYQLRAGNQREISDALRGRQIQYCTRPNWRAKFKHHLIFRDQSLFMHRTPPESMAGALELIVK